MASFFNTTRGPLSYTLSNGVVGSVSPKSWAKIEDGVDACSDILRLVQQGFLVRKQEHVRQPRPIVVKRAVVSTPAVVKAAIPVENVSVSEPPRKRRKRSTSKVAQSEITSDSSSVE